jgi:hypothetical protein
MARTVQGQKPKRAASSAGVRETPSGSAGPPGAGRRPPAGRVGQGASVLYTGVTRLLYLTGCLRLRRRAGAPPSEPRPGVLARTTAPTAPPAPPWPGRVVASKLPSCPCPPWVAPPWGRRPASASRRAIGGGAPPLLPCPGPAQLNLPSQGCSRFSGRSSDGVCGEIAGEREIAENRQDPPARTRRTRRTPPRLLGPAGADRATPACPAAAPITGLTGEDRALARGGV